MLYYPIEQDIFYFNENINYGDITSGHIFYFTKPDNIQVNKIQISFEHQFFSLLSDSNICYTFEPLYKEQCVLFEKDK